MQGALTNAKKFGPHHHPCGAAHEASRSYSRQTHQECREFDKYECAKETTENFIYARW